MDQDKWIKKEAKELIQRKEQASPEQQVSR